MNALVLPGVVNGTEIENMEIIQVQYKTVHEA